MVLKLAESKQEAKEFGIAFANWIYKWERKKHDESRIWRNLDYRKRDDRFPAQRTDRQDQRIAGQLWGRQWQAGGGQDAGLSGGIYGFPFYGGGKAAGGNGVSGDKRAQRRAC